MEPLKITKVAIIGCGIMGSKIAWACLVNGLEVLLYDVSPEQQKNSVNKIKDWLFNGRISTEKAEQTLQKCHVSDSMASAVQNVDLAFENVYELLELKKKVHEEIGRVAPKNVLIGSNASSQLCTPLAEASGRPDKFFNMNFSDPLHEELVEYMGNPLTSEETKQSALDWARTIKMVPIVVRKEIMGYAFNRIWRAIKKECLFIVDRGVASPHDVDRAWMLHYGTPYGPFGLMDRVGLDTVANIEMRYFEASGDPSDIPPKSLTDMITNGYLGEKTGEGFYTWPEPEYQKPGWLRKEPPWDGDK